MKIPAFLLAAIAALIFSCQGFAVNSAEKPTEVLPNEFSGWTLSSNTPVSKDPVSADPLNAAVLREYGFSDFSSAIYLRDDGRKLTVRAARFQDASGAYGAFTFYKTPEMQKEKIGDQGASFNERVLFYRGNILIDAQFKKLSAMSAAELRDLASVLPPPPANASGLPGLPAYLPTKNYVKNSAKYIVGPAALEKSSAPLSAQLVDFSAGAEAVLGDYTTVDNPNSPAKLLLISYPTPQIALQHFRKIDADQHQQPAAPDLPATFDKRTGPIVAVVGGPVSPSDAKQLLSLVNYEADVTWNQNTFFSKKDDPANLIVNLIYLCAIIGGFAVVSGVAFGGVRILAKRLFPDRFFDRPEMGLVSLHLSGDGKIPRSEA
jgi:hypothetical protein